MAPDTGPWVLAAYGVAVVGVLLYAAFLALKLRLLRRGRAPAPEESGGAGGASLDGQERAGQ